MDTPNIHVSHVNPSLMVPTPAHNMLLREHIYDSELQSVDKFLSFWSLSNFVGLFSDNLNPVVDDVNILVELVEVLGGLFFV